MNHLYQWLSIAVGWSITATIVAGAAGLAWHKRHHNSFMRRVGNAWTWVTVFVFGQRWFVPLDGARLLLTIHNYRRPRALSCWERDVVAVNLRYNRRHGWREPAN